MLASTKNLPRSTPMPVTHQRSNPLSNIRPNLGSHDTSRSDPANQHDRQTRRLRRRSLAVSPSRSIHLAANRRPSTRLKIFHRCDNVRRTASRLVLHKKREGKRIVLAEGKAPQPKRPPIGPACLGSLATWRRHVYYEDTIRKSHVHDYAEIATLGHVTRARVRRS